MEFTWSEAKRTANLKAHGLDFVDAALVFESVTFTFEDDRFSYSEQRFCHAWSARWHSRISSSHGERK
jgi:uncharacterized protein